MIAKLPAKTIQNYDGGHRVCDHSEYRDDYSTVVTGRSPSRRDTILVEKGNTYIVAIKIDNPGIWALPCHSDFRTDTGMFMQLVEAPSSLRSVLGTFLPSLDDASSTWGWKILMRVPQKAISWLYPLYR